MTTPYDRRTVSPDNLSLWSQVALFLRPTLGAQYAAWNTRRLEQYAHKVTRLSVPVISIGNITFGGAGKTPLVLSLSKHLVEQGYRPGIVANGHGGRLRKSGALVSDGLRIMRDPAAVGDEAVLLGHALKEAGVPVSAGMYREQVGQLLIDKCGVDCLILDDGFQYRSLVRDADLVLIDATNPFGAGGREAYGFLREPIESLKRASAILITKANLIPLLDLPDTGVVVHRDWLLGELERVVPEDIPRIDVPIVAPHLQRVWHPHEGSQVSDDPISDPLRPATKVSPFPLARPTLPAIDDPTAPQSLLPITALGNPEAFEATCRLAGLHVSQPVRYEDHYQYALGDLIWWNQLISRSTHEGIVVSSKDWIKIHPMRKALQMPCWVLTAELQVPDWSKLYLMPDPQSNPGL